MIFLLHLSVRWNKYRIVIFDFFTFLGSQKTKNQKCLMGLFDTSKDAHLKYDSKRVNIFKIGSLEVYDRGGGSQGLHCIASLHVHRS